MSEFLTHEQLEGLFNEIRLDFVAGATIQYDVVNTLQNRLNADGTVEYRRIGRVVSLRTTLPVGEDK